MKLYKDMTKDEKSAYNRKWMPVTLIAAAIGVVAIVAYISNQPKSSYSYEPQVQNEPAVSIQEMRDKASPLKYRDAVFEKLEKGSIIEFDAQVFWAHPERMLLNINGDVTTGAIVYYDKAPEVLPGDNIKVLGIYDGVETMLGNKYVKVKYLESNPIE